ncbi:MAG: agmatine deiminase family protein [Deltaproteobacteria bacterium]|nr:agmatine deiminase family protein [Deltaproteobacteria bacterium]
MRGNPLLRAFGGVLAGVVASAILVFAIGSFLSKGRARHRLVPEDASGRLERVAIHYTPAMDARAMVVWRQLFRVLPEGVEVHVAVEKPADFVRFLANLKVARVPHLGRFRQVVVGQPITTWSRDRMASIDNDGVLAPPRVSVMSGARAGDWEAPFAIAREVYGARPQISELVFEGGDFAASDRYVFADANLIGRNLGRGEATRAYLEEAVERTFAQDVVFLGDAQGDVPEHHIMMYMVPLDDRRVLVGDVRTGKRLLDAEPDGEDLPVDEDLELHARRFDRVAAQLAARGFEVTRVPVVVLEGAGSYVTYTNALFDRDDDGPVVYLPTYALPALDEAAADLYRALGLRVVPIDLSSLYRLNGSLGCLVNVMSRAR